MNFRESESYLLSLGNEVETMKLGLENIRTLLDALGNPQNNYLKVQVAGTNGKGSVCAFLDSICFEVGIPTGLYTSPHLVSITERIKIGGKDVSEEEFARLATLVRKTSESLVKDGKLGRVPTYFEQVTAMALQAFADAKVELAILETGLGGRYDATTATKAEIAAITPIDLDHQEYLGETIEEIAAEKAAIIHSGSQVVVGIRRNEARIVIADRLLQLSLPAKPADLVRTACVSGRTTFETEKAQYKVEKLGLIGHHQLENAKIAILLAEILQNEFSITPKNIDRGIENARHPGRLEYVGRFLFDGAHNIAGAKALREYLDEFVTQPITMIFAAMRDKEIGEIGEILFPKANTLILTKPENSRSIEPDEIVRTMSAKFGRTRIVITQNVKDAIAKAIEVTDDDALILVTGSLYLVGEAKEMIDN